MNQFRDSVIRSIEDIGCSVTPEAVWIAVKVFALSHGYEHMLALKRTSDDVTVVYSDMPVGFADALRDAGVSHDALLSARASSTLATPHGEGLIVPAYRGETGGVVLFVGADPDKDSIVRSALHLLAHSALEQITRLAAHPRRKDVGLLSPREIECLRWAAAGKTDVEIGRILTISPRTTRFHIENAKKKLGVSTRVQAVTEALRLRAIAA
jgi:DNA-binding CsgD family transcriptional regulator